MKFKVKFEGKAVGKRQKERLKQAQYLLDNQVMGDSNEYIPYQDGTLYDSVFTASRPGEGEVAWATPYARRRYYEPAILSTAVNPNASTMWFEKAKAAYLKDWVKIVADRMGGKNG